MCKPFYNLRVRFAQCEMSQNEVARAAGMASSTMTARMTGAQPFDAWQIEKIAKTLNIPPEEYGKYFFDPKKAVCWQRRKQALHGGRCSNTSARLLNLCRIQMLGWG